MQKSSKLFWSCLAGIATLVCFADVNAAPRSMVGASNRAGATSTARMPTMPTMSINTVGTHAVSGVPGTGTTSTGTTTGGTTGGGTNGGSTTSDDLVEPLTEPACPDGAARDSEYTVDKCMKSLTRCVQTSVQGGVAGLFNEEVRNSVISGMGVCASDIDKCISDVRIDCHNVYSNFVDVWLDFNSRVVQPEYYNFVLRKTGLTPNQAKNVCELLDKNTYGKSFAAVSNSYNVTSEYNSAIGAYNEQAGGGLSKNQPQGPTVNTTANGNNGVDGERGHYARWDASNAVCKIRVAAYNKDKLITNKWLFGALGDDKSAEVWQDAGSTFTCNKDLFDFSLLNDTHTVGVVGIGGGTLLGAGIGALAGHGDLEFDCGNADSRKQLASQIQKNTNTLNKYLGTNAISGSSISVEQCDAIVNLYNNYIKLKSSVDLCSDVQKKCTISYTVDEKMETLGLEKCEDIGKKITVDEENNTIEIVGKNATAQLNEEIKSCIELCGGKRDSSPIIKRCMFKSLKNGTYVTKEKDGVLCQGEYNGCLETKAAKAEVSELDDVFANVDLSTQKSNRVKTTLVGAGIGLGAGTVATAITAFVERNNISCHVGDGLNTVGFGKSFTIGTLKDYYVKWNLHVADSVLPTTVVGSCQQWIDACGMYGEDECATVELNYQRPGRNTTGRVNNACVFDTDTNVCTPNAPIAISYGACERNNGGGNNGGESRWFAPEAPNVIQH